MDILSLKLMRRTQPETIKTLLLAYLRANCLEAPLNEHRLLATWPAVVGTAVAKQTLSAEICNQTLVVRIASPVVRSELMMKRKMLTQKLNDAVGALVIYDIQIL